MREDRVQEYYDMLKFYYLKPDSDWTDKAKAMRTVAHDFYNEITRSYGTFADALKEFYKWSKYDDVSKAAFFLKDQLNDIVHQNKQIDSLLLSRRYAFSILCCKCMGLTENSLKHCHKNE